MVYRIKHLPTGLFLKPVSGRRKSNLPKKGKIYLDKPTEEQAKTMSVMFGRTSKCFRNNLYVDVNTEDIQIEEC